MNNKVLWILFFVVMVGGALFFTLTDDDVIKTETGDDATEEGQPNEDGEPASSAETATQPVAAPAQPTQTSAPSTPTPTNTETYDENGNVIVRYTSNGFAPSVVEIEPGDAVVFVNDNILPMWVKAQAHPTAEYFEYASLNQGRSSYRGEEYIFTFTQKGSWGYMNLNKESHRGVVIVTD